MCRHSDYCEKPTKPVMSKPVSMKDALRAYSNGRAMSGAESINLLNSTQREDVRHEGGIAAVLDAAGVQYVD